MVKYCVTQRKVWTVCEGKREGPWVELVCFVFIISHQLLCKQTNELRDQSNTQKETCHSRNICSLIKWLDL